MYVVTPPPFAILSELGEQLGALLPLVAGQDQRADVRAHAREARRARRGRSSA